MSKASVRCEGIVVPLVTPIDENEAVDEAGLKRLIDFMAEGGVHGVFVMGSTGEVARFDEGQWLRAVEIAARHAKGRSTVYAGAMMPGLEQSLRRVRLAESAGADVVVLTPGFYYPLSQDEMVRYFCRIAEEANLPVCLYNIPPYTSSVIEPETLAKVADAVPVAGIKDSSGDIDLIARYLEVAKARNLPVLAGSESILAGALRLGAAGAVPSLGNVFPKLFVEVYDAGRSGEWNRVDALCGVIGEINKLNGFTRSSLATVSWKKYALERMGICSARTTEPAEPLSEEYRNAVDAVLRQHGLLPSQR